MNALTNPALEPYVGDALKNAVGKNPLIGGFAHFNGVMDALKGRREAWDGLGIDKMGRIDAMLTKWDGILVEQREEASQPAVLSGIRYQGIINILREPDLLKPDAG